MVWSKLRRLVGLDIDEEEAGRAARAGRRRPGRRWWRSSRVTVASKVRPSPSAVITPPVAAPGRTRLPSASRSSGERGRGSCARPRRSAFRQQPQQHQTADRAAQKFCREDAARAPPAASAPRCRWPASAAMAAIESHARFGAWRAPRYRGTGWRAARRGRGQAAARRRRWPTTGRSQPPAAAARDRCPKLGGTGRASP